MRWAEQAIALAPYRETGYRRLMDAHIAAGNRGEALQVYERCRQLLAEELGAYPSPETESIYRGLLEAPAVQAGATAASESPQFDTTALAHTGARIEWPTARPGFTEDESGEWPWWLWW